jgi:hypothetical protein
MAVRTLRVVAWSAALLSIGVALVLRAPTSVAPDEPASTEATGAFDEPDAALNPGSAESAEDSRPSAKRSES